MKILSSALIKRPIAGCLVALLAAQLAQAATALPEQAIDAQQQQSTIAPQSQGAPASSQPSQGADSGTGKLIADPAQSQQAAQPQPADQSGQSGNSQPPPAQQQNGAAKPVGTAVAPDEKVTGVAASRPAGAVIAPARQRRVRSFLIKFGVVVGAGVAVGTVLALSHGSPSRPQ
jgi:hypothetical protein